MTTATTTRAGSVKLTDWTSYRAIWCGRCNRPDIVLLDSRHADLEVCRECVPVREESKEVLTA